MCLHIFMCINMCFYTLMHIYIYMYIHAVSIYIYIYIPVNPLTGVETNGLTNSILPDLILSKAVMFLSTSCVQDIHIYVYISYM